MPAIPLGDLDDVLGFWFWCGLSLAAVGIGGVNQWTKDLSHSLFLALCISNKDRKENLNNMRKLM